MHSEQIKKYEDILEEQLNEIQPIMNKNINEITSAIERIQSRENHLNESVSAVSVFQYSLQRHIGNTCWCVPWICRCNNY
jgi:hypothetical protein